MTRARVISGVAATVWILVLAPVATAQLDDRLWVGPTGNQLWQVDANWNPAPFPNDPGRVDPDPMVVSNVVGANLGVNLPANLSVDVGATDVTVAALSIGSTGSAVTTNITSSGGRLVFENFELNNETPDPDVCAFNCGAAQITSGGVAGVTNTISAVVGVNDAVDVVGTRNLTLSGGIADIGTNASLRARTPGLTVFVTGNITTLNQLPDGGMFDAPLGLNTSATSQGTLDISGVITGNGRVRIGTPETGSTLLGTVILRSANTYNSRTFVGRGNVVMANNSAFGTANSVIRPEGAPLQTGFNFRSNDDTRTIANPMEIAEWATAKGENSMTFTGRMWQTNTRGWINMLPGGTTLTLGGGLFPKRTSESPTILERDMTIDGTGKTLLTGGLRNEFDDDTMTEDPGNAIGSFRFRGTGTVVVSGGLSTYQGGTIMEGANVHFATNADLGNTAGVESVAGAIGVDAGVIGNSTFLGKLNNVVNPAPDEAGNLVVYDRGGLMLAAGEYGSNLDFTSGDMANAGNMSLAAHETGSTYTGTITPAASTYRFGGGSGVLTLPNANQLTGANSLFVTNGGEVRITANNNYTGTTSISAKYVTTLQNAAAADTTGFTDGDNIPNDQIYLGTTLSVGTLANGGVASNIGSSSNAASNLYIQGSTLKYTGGAVSTDRLFTVGSGGATIDASGTGALSFTNTGSLGVDIAETRNGTVNAFAGVNGAADQVTVRALESTEDLRIGMPIIAAGATGIPAGAVITRISSATEVTFNIPNPSAFHINSPISFGPSPERRLTLAGTNTGNNTLAAVVPNASDGGLVGVAKTGSSKWVLTGNNTYSGVTRVEEGILSITNPYLADASDVRMFSGGIFDLNFSGTDAIDELFFDGAPQAAGTWGAIGNALAMHQSAFFTGPGLLGVNTFNISTLMGDYNQNGVVDAADYVVWREAAAAGATTLTNRSGTITGVVGDADYNFWRSRFGMAVVTGAAVGSAAVPEPAAAMLAVIVFVGMLGQFNRRYRTTNSL